MTMTNKKEMNTVYVYGVRHKQNQTNMDYQKEIKTYIDSLDSTEANLAQRVMNDYMERGKTPRYVYLAFKQLNNRSLKKFYYLMFSKGFLEQIQKQYLYSVAEDLDNIIFNGYADADALSEIHKYFDVEEYRHAERSALYKNKGYIDAYKDDVLKWIAERIQGLPSRSVAALEDTIDRVLAEGGEHDG